ncbi:MAG: sugar kinase [Chloroflexota bacterium]|nr:sugar kinase [Chloroflexota bacterium]
MTDIKQIVSFGEAMIRLTPPGHERLERTISLNVTGGGAELNVGVTVACLGHRAVWVSALPDNALGRSIVRSARAHGVDASKVAMLPESAGRTGLYFLEEGTDPRPSSVLYDRARSAMALLEPGHFNWTELLQGASAFMVSGITPALGKGAREETMASIKAARAAGIPVFFDLNYRSKLWTEDEARASFVEIAPLVDVMFASKGGLNTFFGIEGEDHTEVLTSACTRLGLAACVLTRKKGKASRSQKMAAIGALADGTIAETDWKAVEIVDRVGGGDAFAGGFIVGYLEQPENLRFALDLGLSASALKHTMVGDFLCATRDEIEAAILADEGGVLQR